MGGWENDCRRGALTHKKAEDGWLLVVLRPPTHQSSCCAFFVPVPGCLNFLVRPFAAQRPFATAKFSTSTAVSVPDCILPVLLNLESSKFRSHGSGGYPLVGIMRSNTDYSIPAKKLCPRIYAARRAPPARAALNDMQ